MSESLESLALEAAGNVDDGKSVDGLSELLRALAGACRERDALRGWKQSQLTVEGGWDAQAVGRLLGVKLGYDIRPAIEPEVRRLIAERDALRAELEALRSQEPVATYDGVEFSRYTLRWVDGPIQIGAPLYAAPQPPREVERLTDEQIRADTLREAVHV